MAWNYIGHIIYKGVWRPLKKLLKLYLRSRASKNILLYWGQNDPSVITPQKEILGHPIGGVGGWVEHLVSPPSWHFLGGSESVKVLGVQGLVWSGTCLFMSLQLDVNQLVSEWGGIKTWLCLAG